MRVALAVTVTLALCKRTSAAYSKQPLGNEKYTNRGRSMDYLCVSSIGEKVLNRVTQALQVEISKKQ